MSTSIDVRLLTIVGLTCALASILSNLPFKVLVKSFVVNVLPVILSTLLFVRLFKAVSSPAILVIAKVSKTVLLVLI